MLITIHVKTRNHEKHFFVASDYDAAFFIVFELLEKIVVNNLGSLNPRYDLMPYVVKVVDGEDEITTPWYLRYKKLGLTSWKEYNMTYGAK